MDMAYMGGQTHPLSPALGFVPNGPSKLILCYSACFVKRLFSFLEPPKFIQEPEDKQVLKTFTTSLTCLTSGTPPARIDWSKKSVGGRFVPVPLEKPRFEKLVNGTLVIRNASDEDDGTYLCTGANGVSDVVVNRQIQLKVHGMKLLVFFSG